jgi:hypothetical protein
MSVGGVVVKIGAEAVVDGVVTAGTGVLGTGKGIVLTWLRFRPSKL